MGYIGKPEDVASIVSYLASKEAHFITGETGWSFKASASILIYSQDKRSVAFSELVSHSYAQ